MLFLAYTGLRWGEMAALCVGDLDVPRRRVNVNRAVAEVGRDLIYGTPKNRSRRTVPLPEFLEPSLQYRIRGTAEDAFVLPLRLGVRCVTEIGTGGISRVRFANLSRLIPRSRRCRPRPASHGGKSGNIGRCQRESGTENAWPQVRHHDISRPQ